MPFPHHILVVPVAARSHVRILSQLSFNILAIHPTTCLTFVMTPASAPMLDDDISLQSRKWREEMEGRYRIVTKGEQEQNPRMQMMQVLQVFPSFWKEVMSAKGKEGFNKMPCLLIFDLFASGIRGAIKESGSTIPLLPLIPSSSLTWHALFPNESEGGMLDGMVGRYERNKAEGMDKDEAAMKAFRNVQNRLFNLPDLPPMYDYELTPQSLARNMDEGTIMFMANMYEWLKAARGAICLGVPELEADGLENISKCTDGPVFGVGPQLSDAVWANEPNPSEKNTQGDAIFSFLDDALAKYGENSAAYISFGTNFWPTKRYEIVEWIVESLLAQDPPIPFIFSTPTDGKIDDGLKKRIEESGRGMVVDWCAQVRILQHPATGIFLTHCGNGSLTEAIVAGVPMMALPFAADQPAQVAFYVTKHKCGYDLRELKTGFAGLPLGDGYIVEGTKEAAMTELHETWTKLRGENGRDVRENVQRIRDIWLKSWTEGGSRKAVESLNQFFQ